MNLSNNLKYMTQAIDKCKHPIFRNATFILCNNTVALSHQSPH
ncbi:hypothetical protein ACFSKU_10100 [Pontibacter silvestris]|uniref:Uncharacterized protein n=1 Tax=Pontibacter silvestris TaxID=2305183 RepID=A0ABW4WZ07_9BACT|nr:hypothetical protein [Pontibacter silvestris]